jgi:protein-S-isoprenylcysteine O-methyltransferase Ste14
MWSSTRHVIGSAAFFLAAPGVVAGLVPYLLTGWRLQEPLGGLTLSRVPGAALILVGLACLVDSFARFAIQGEGTPAPIAPTRHLVVTGAYRHVRNPMYLAVAGIVVGQALLLGSLELLGYSAGVWIFFHLFIIAYEEPTLRRQHDDWYRTYASNVHRWWPRLRPWRSPGPVSDKRPT